MAVRGDEEVHVNTVGQVAQLVELVNSQVLQVRHLQHVGSQEGSLEGLDLRDVYPAPVDVVHHDPEDGGGEAMYLYLLVPALRHAAAEHGVEVLTVGSQHHPVPGEGLALHHQAHVSELLRLLQHL